MDSDMLVQSVVSQTLQQAFPSPPCTAFILILLTVLGPEAGTEDTRGKQWVTTTHGWGWAQFPRQGRRAEARRPLDGSWRHVAQNPHLLGFVSFCLFKSPERHGNYLFLALFYILSQSSDPISTQLFASISVQCTLKQFIYACVCACARACLQDEDDKYLHKRRNCVTIWRQPSHSTAHHWLISELSSIVSNERI